MTWYELAGDWQQFTAMVKRKWDKVTDADLTTFGGQSNQLSRILQAKYGYTREQADKEIIAFARK
jgi:uncharacterized protein YjbJ (UPF0337 family)